MPLKDKQLRAAYDREYRLNNRVILSEKGKQSRKLNGDKRVVYGKQYYSENKAKWRKLYLANREAILEFKRVDRLNRLEAYKAIDRKTAIKNHHKRVEKATRRRIDKLNATPKWLTAVHIQEMQVLYKEAKDLTNSTGVKHEVDHEVPIKGKNVRGLHVPWNLNIMTKTDNIKKGNKY